MQLTRLNYSKVNNAAQTSQQERYLTSEGLVSTLATNHFGPFTFTMTLLPLLKKTASMSESDVRIVNVSTHGMDEIDELLIGD